MFNQLKLLFKGFTSKSEEIVQTKQEIEKPVVEQCEKLVNVREQQEKITTTNSYDINQVRRRITCEMSAEEMQSLRERDRNSKARWFGERKATDTGSFNALELERRIHENAYREDEEVIEALPAIEDTFMAFTKPEVDLFDDKSISLSGVFRALHPNEDFDEEYSMPLITMREHIEELTYGYESMDAELSKVNFDQFNDTIIRYEDLKAAFPDAHYAAATVEELNFAPEEMNYVSEEIHYVSQEINDVVEPVAVESVSAKRPTFTFNLFDDIEEDFEAQMEITQEMPVYTPTLTTKSMVQPKEEPIVQRQDTYWIESDRLARFGRRRTSASCSSTRLRALSPVA